jgi:N-acetyl-gamma-glutamyl-phosphate reductase
MPTVFIDGHEGTTGLQILDRLKEREDIELIEIPGEKRKDVQTKTGCLNEADLVILCLPDGAARESVGLIHNRRTKVIDASTAHRISDGWVYGLPERNKAQREKIRLSNRVSNAGCYATGFILAVYPLIHLGIMPVDYPATIHAVSGYSGGGKKLIHTYEKESHTDLVSLSHRPYALGLNHKHVPEMQQWTGLSYPPVFNPAVGNFYNGMLVCIPLVSRLLCKAVSAENIQEILSGYYETEPFVQVMPFGKEDYLEAGFLSATACNGTNRIELLVFGHQQQILLVARLDNLGKGASGAAVQNMNIMLNVEEGRGLIL